MMDKFFFMGKSTLFLSGNMSQFFINNQPKRMTQTQTQVSSGSGSGSAQVSQAQVSSGTGQASDSKSL